MKNEKDKPGEPSAELLETAQRGDVNALWKLWESCQTKVAWTLRRRFPDIPSADIDDLVQITGIKVLQKLWQFHWEIGKFDSWVICIALNSARDHFRKCATRISTTQLADWMDIDPEAAWVIGMRPSSIHPLEIISSKERIAAIYHQINKLPETQRLCLLMAIDWKSYGEISEITGYSIASVGGHLHLARKALRNLR